MIGSDPTVPTCLDEGQAVFLGSCIAEMPPPGMDPVTHQGLCQQYMWLAELPYCAGTTRLPIPSCLSEEEARGIDYCHYGDGSSPYWNALCWGTQKDPAWWAEYTNVPACPGVTPPSLPGSVVMAPADEVLRPEPKRRANMLLYGAIGLGALAVVGAGIYYARKH